MNTKLSFSRSQVASRVAHDIAEGWTVNLGVGMPTLVASSVPQGKQIIFHSENGLLGMGPEPSDAELDPWLINAGKQPVTLNPGASLFNHAESFAMIRGGHLDLCVLGAYEVSSNGDIANWMVADSDRVPAVGGAMDLTAGAKAVWVMMEQLTRSGEPKIVERCMHPLTALGVVKRIYTEYATYVLESGKVTVTSMIEGMTSERLQGMTHVSLDFDFGEGMTGSDQ